MSLDIGELVSILILRTDDWSCKKNWLISTALYTTSTELLYYIKMWGYLIRRLKSTLKADHPANKMSECQNWCQLLLWQRVAKKLFCFRNLYFRWPVPFRISYIRYTVFDLIREHTLISGHPICFFLFFFKFFSIFYLFINNYFKWLSWRQYKFTIYRPDGHNGEDYCQST